MNKHIIMYMAAGLAATPCAYAQQDSTRTHELLGVTVSSKSGVRRTMGAVDGVTIGRAELFRAACCNLGESFVTNPSVDVSYTDAATGAKQIKLLGLSGSYVQMLTEAMPAFRGAAQPYALGYVPGTWMKSIQVSKGTASVKNGYEAMTGQINIEYLKPEDERAVGLNVYGDTKTRFEANADGNIHIAPNLSTIILAHAENTFEEHDENGDAFLDKPKVKQVNLANRWYWREGNYLFHGGASLLSERRKGGVDTEHGDHADHCGEQPPYTISIEADRYEGYMKHALILNAERNANIALMASASMQELGSAFGYRHYHVNEKNVYASIIYESDFATHHNLSTGLSLNYDYLSQRASTYRLTLPSGLSPKAWRERETTPGIYAQYTYTLGTRLTAMAGLRADHSSLHGTFWTPRFHVKWSPIDMLAIRLSAGKGYRTVHALAENNYLMASGRKLVVDDLRQEAAWNYGASASLTVPVAGRTLKLNAEYYHTRFSDQVVTDYDTDPNILHITNLEGRSRSHTVQVDATYPFFEGFTLTAAYRLNDAKTTYGGRLLERPLTSKWKGLITAQYKTPLEKWQFDVTLQLNGGGRMPTPYTMASGNQSWEERYGAFEQLSAQVTREFRHFSVYIGGENLTNFRQPNPIIGAAAPYTKEFEPTLVWGPVHGRMAYVGARVKI